MWGLFKRSLVGSFHKVSVKHLDRYLSELEWRFNNRDNDHIFVDNPVPHRADRDVGLLGTGRLASRRN